MLKVKAFTTHINTSSYIPCFFPSNRRKKKQKPPTMQYHSLKHPSKQVVFLYLSLFVCLPLSISICNFAEDGAATRGMFVFGSSLVDNGNNNFFESRAKADYLPYGIDFPNGPSGRFTNGKNVVDLLGDQLKLPSFIPPSKDPSTKGSKIVHGVNHASGSSGILDDTGSVVVGRTILIFVI